MSQRHKGMYDFVCQLSWKSRLSWRGMFGQGIKEFYYKSSDVCSDSPLIPCVFLSCGCEGAPLKLQGRRGESQKATSLVLKSCFTVRYDSMVRLTVLLLLFSHMPTCHVLGAACPEQHCEHRSEDQSDILMAVINFKTAQMEGRFDADG